MTSPKPEDLNALGKGETLDEKFSKKFNALKSKGLFSFTKSNSKDTISYIVAITGIVFLFFQSFFGELLIGVVAGLYFAPELYAFSKNIQIFIEELGTIRGIIFGIVVLALFILAKGIFIGTLFSLGLRYLFTEKDNSL